MDILKETTYDHFDTGVVCALLHAYQSSSVFILCKVLTKCVCVCVCVWLNVSPSIYIFSFHVMLPL